MPATRVIDKISELIAGAIANGSTATTQSANDNSTKLATTAYADRVGMPNITIPMLLSSTTVNLNEGTGAKQALYPCPANRRCIITNIVMQKFSANPFTVEFQFGWDASATDISALIAAINVVMSTTRSLNLATPDASSGQQLMVSQPTSGTAGDILGLKVTTPEGATLTAKVDIFGYWTDTNGVPIANVVGIAP